MLRIILTSFMIVSASSFAQDRPDPAEWAKNTRNLRECYDVAEDVYSQTHRENRYMTCIKVFSGTFDRKYCPHITSIDYIKGPTTRKIALHLCQTFNQAPKHQYEPREDEPTSIIFNTDNY